MAAHPRATRRLFFNSLLSGLYEVNMLFRLHHDCLIHVVYTFLLCACTGGSTNSLQGYAEGEYIRVAAPFAGTLDKLHVQRGAEVAAGALLFSLEQVNEAAARREAEQRLRRAEAQLENLQKGKRPSEIDSLKAQLAQAEAVLKLSEAQFKRQEQLFKSAAVGKEQLDQSTAARQREQARVQELNAQLVTARLAAREDEIAAARAEVAAAQAVLAQAEWRLAQKTVLAPLAGRVDDTLYTQGEWVPAGSPIVSLLPPQNIKIRFFVPEPQLTTLRMGQAIQVSCDGCGAGFEAQISFISSQAEYTPPLIYSKETRAKLVFLVEARPPAQHAASLHPGQPLDITLKP